VPKSFLQCEKTAPREYGLWTCVLARDHSGPHLHVCSEPATTSRAWTEWDLHPRGHRLRVRSLSRDEYTEAHARALAEFQARP
jgi:hypothetical protein